MENDTVNASGNGTETKYEATPEGMAMAYGSLVIMAVLPIFYGSFKSVKHHEEKKESGERPDTMSKKDAAMFPLIASCALFGLYIFFTLFSKAYINMLLTSYFFFLGVLAFAQLASPLIAKLIPASLPQANYNLSLTKEDNNASESLIHYKFNNTDIVCLIISAFLGVWYLFKKHWVANNLFGLAFSVKGVELLHLNNVITGYILLGGLFIYDIFWVFGTNVMVTVAKSFEAPIKLIFPQDFLESGFSGSHFAMLGLGDIVIPGIFIALLLRFDNSLNRGKQTYFYASFFAYFLGLMTTIFVMHVFKHAQPALLYLVPACIIIPLLVAVVNGDTKAMFSYEDHPSEEVDKKSD